MFKIYQHLLNGVRSATLLHTLFHE